MDQEGNMKEASIMMGNKDISKPAFEEMIEMGKIEISKELSIEEKIADAIINKLTEYIETLYQPKLKLKKGGVVVINRNLSGDKNCINSEFTIENQKFPIWWNIDNA